MDTPQDKVRFWFELPILHVKNSYGGDGAFVALMASFALAERLVKAVIDSKHEHPDKDFQKYLTSVLDVDPAIGPIFWNMYRDGMMHFSQPFSGKLRDGGDILWGWDIKCGYSHLPSIIEIEPKKKVIAINPWTWFEHVIQKYSEYPVVYDIQDSRKLGEIRSDIETQKQVQTDGRSIVRPQQNNPLTQGGTGICNL